MDIKETYLKGCFVISPKIIEDERGYFFECFNYKLFNKITRTTNTFVQDNQSKSSRGVLRGMHYQVGEHAQAKLVRVIKGKVLDVCLDIRKDSSTFGKYLSIILDDVENKQLYIPRGFAHGFLVLEDETIFSYKCDNYYYKDSERGILYKDPTIKIDWNFPDEEIILSEKDKHLPTFETVFK